MIIEPVTYTDALWDEVKRYAAACSWRAGKSLAQEMQNHAFSDWERVFVLHENGNIYGYCTVAKKDCIPDLTYTPYIGYLFVDEKNVDIAWDKNSSSQQWIICETSDFMKSIWSATMKTCMKNMDFPSSAGQPLPGVLLKKSIINPSDQR